jgi:hypothetical protein
VAISRRSEGEAPLRSVTRIAQRPQPGTRPPAGLAGRLEVSSLLALQRSAGNAAVETLLAQRDDAGTAVKAADPAVKAPDPALTEATTLATEAPATNKDMAGWVLRAQAQGFVTFTAGMGTQKNLEDFRDGKKIGDADPADTTIFGGLQTMHALATGHINRWVADPTKAKTWIQLGSFIRTGGSAGKHGKGAAIDINQGDFTGSADDVIAVLKDLPVGSYGLGMPFQGDFLPPERKLDAMEEAEASKPEPGPISGALVRFNAPTYKAAWNPATKKYGDPEVDTWGGAATLLKSGDLRKQLKAMKEAGSTVMVFPDNDNHLHVDRR